MRTRKLFAWAFAGLLALVGSGIATGQTLYGATGANTTTSNLLILDPATGAMVSTVGPIGFAVSGLAVHPITGVLYGSTSNQSAVAPGSLITIDKTTGVGTLVGSFGSPGQTMADITFTSDGTLYGWLEASSDDLHTINLATGAATDVGDAGLSTFGSGLAANGANVIFYAGSGSLGALRTINAATGSPTTVATMTGGTGNAVSAMAFSPGGVLYAVDLDNGTKNSQLMTVNTTTGAITILGPSVNSLDAIAFDGAVAPPSGPIAIPAMSPGLMAALALLLAAGAWLTLRRRG
jgi:WD40 repeat protein